MPVLELRLAAKRTVPNATRTVPFDAERKFMKKYKLELIVFLSGAIGMGLELIAARVLSPYVGSSNVVWTSIIGIILVSMSLGYWIGGKKADKSANTNELSNILLYAAVATSAIPLLETCVVRILAGTISNLIIAAILCAIIVFSIPSFILAMISPFAVKIKSKEDDEIGSLSGRISSLSTIGSIFGTFLMGFVLIPHIGVSNINIGITIILLVISLLAREKFDKKFIILSICLAIIMAGLIIFGKVTFKLANPDILLDTDSQYSRIWVKQVETEKETFKTLQVDTGLESYINTETGEMGAKYLRFYDLFEYFNKDAKSTLLIGGAAYTYPIHYLQKYSDKTIDVIEIDDKMTQIAAEQFGLNINEPRLSIYNQDGRSYLNYSKNKYDTILIDAFKGTNAPFELTTYEALSHAKNMLNENGIVFTNIIGSIEGEKSEFIKYEYSTYKAVFDDVKIFMVQNKNRNDSQNLILVGIKGNPEKDISKYQEYSKYLDMEVTEFESDKQIVTDDFAPIGN